MLIKIPYFILKEFGTANMLESSLIMYHNMTSYIFIWNSLVTHSD
jgi:hypothetical protein